MKISDKQYDYKSVQIPIPKIAYFKQHWINVYTPLTSLDLEVMMNLATTSIDLRILKSEDSQITLERGDKFIQTILKGYNPKDGVHILKHINNDIIKFNVKDVRRMNCNNITRAIGRIVGREGKIKNQIEVTSNTKILIIGSDVNIIGDVEGIKIAKESICRLIMGANPGSIDRNLKKINSKLRNSFFENTFINK